MTRPGAVAPGGSRSMIDQPALVEFLNVHDAGRRARVEALVRRHLRALGLAAAIRHTETDPVQPGVLRVNGASIDIARLAGLSEPDLSELLRRRIAQIAGRRTVLFVCTGNAIRSQIAEAIVNHFLAERWAAFSGGTLPLAIHRDTIEVMREIGIDLSDRHAKPAGLFCDCSFDTVVILCADAGMRCPAFPYAARIDRLHFDDPLAPDVAAGAIVFNSRAQLRALRDRMKKAIFSYLAGAQ